LLLETSYTDGVKSEHLEVALHRRPFRPFEMRVDGEVIRVLHPEQVLLAEHKMTVIMDLGDRIHITDAANISKITWLRRQSPADENVMFFNPPL